MHLVTQQAEVVAVHANSVEVVPCEANSGCGSCSLKATCGQAILARYFGRKNPSFSLKDTSGLQVGDKITLGLEAKKLNLAAVLQFLLPLLTLLAAALVAQSLGWSSGFSLLISAGVGLALGFLLARLLAKPPELTVIR